MFPIEVKFQWLRLIKLVPTNWITHGTTKVNPMGRGKHYLAKGPTQILHHDTGAKEKSGQSWSLWHKHSVIQLSKNSAFMIGLRRVLNKGWVKIKDH